ncbi:MAG TPA: TIGR03435 family protein [Dongiaceae bacterium]|jgi:uncharacterized protein (TIGR03435 family)|nr:TIGR03435 family protein [Dongiaceae bacterium]
MTAPDDQKLLADFVRTASETAFAALVARHINLVFSTARRLTGNAHSAEEITQAVFLILARKAGSLRAGAVLPGWLYHTTRLTAANYVKGEIRRERREQEAYMQSTTAGTEPAWEEIAPLLDEAMGRLGTADRNAVVLRFFENKTAAEVAAALQTTEAAAHKRVQRALEKLRRFFTRRGVTLTGTLLAGAVSAHAVAAAPIGLTATIATAATQGATVGSGTITLVKGVLKLMAWTKAKTAIVIATGVLLAAGATTVAVRQIRNHAEPEQYFLNMDWQAFQKIPPRYFILRPTRFSGPMHNGTGATAMGNPNRSIGRAQGMQSMIEYAYYYFNRARIVWPAEPFPEQHYDFLVTVPGALEKMQAEIASRYGYAAHKEVRNTDVWLLRVAHPGAPGLKPGIAAGVRTRNPNRFIDIDNFPFPNLINRLESYLEQPVVDATGLQGNFNVRLDWTDQNNTAPAKAKLRQAVLDQLGLELVPINMPVELFVVEKIR